MTKAWDNVQLTAIADQVGTPTYVYRQADIDSAVEMYYNSFGRSLQSEATDFVLCYAIKANSHGVILRSLAERFPHLCFDIVSGGELAKLLACGISPQRIVFSGPGKSQAELMDAVQHGIRCIYLESHQEFDMVLRAVEALDAQAKANVGIRANLDIDAATLQHISTGRADHKFGVPEDDIPLLLEKIAVAQRQYQNQYQSQDQGMVSFHGISAHIGSQISQIEPYLQVAQKLCALVDIAEEKGLSVTELDIGGGFAVAGEDDQTLPLQIDQLAQAIQTTGITEKCRSIALVPGRSIVARAGSLLTRVIQIKPSGTRQFAVVDAALNDYIRVALYQASLDVEPLSSRSTGTATYDLVGPVCETTDTFKTSWETSELMADDLLRFKCTGAYGAVMSSTYNGRSQPAEVLIRDDNSTVLISEREDVAKQWSRECEQTLTLS